ncbi:hypothetical protein DSM112329_01647 [Paraconexibacter sp. AEG42_29]|uniref:Mce/MlaD domain-containing protein n=1 Tax=Paraconexibacter sp. AEG42_29 TaxID=2997339 RepID=A0AAU7ATZ1_9ACTN
MTEIRRGPKRRLSLNVLGLLGVLVIFGVVYFSFAKRVPFIYGYRIEAVVSNSSQLRKGSPVRVAGVDVGKVVKLSEGPGTTAVLQLEFKDSALPLHQDATLRIRPRLFLEGGFYIELRAGSPSAPVLEDGGTIPLGQTSVPVQFDQVLSSLDRPTRESLRRTVDNLSTGFDKGAARAFGDAAKPFTPALRDTAQIAQATRGLETHDLSNLIGSLAEITGTLAANDDALGQLVGGLNVTAGALASQQANLRASVRGLDDLSQTAIPELQAISRGLPSVVRFTDALRPTLPRTPGTLRNLSKVLTQVRLASRPAELPAALSATAPTINRLPTLSTRLQGLFKLVTPVTDCVRDKVLPVLYTNINDGANSTGRPVWQDLAHAAVGLSGASSSFDANGPSVRFLAAVGTQSLATGALPGLGQLVGVGPELEGSSPKWLGNGVTSPFRPDAVCRDQPSVNLQSRTPFPEAAPQTTAIAKRAAKQAAAEPASTVSRRIGSRTKDAAPSALRDALRDVATSVTSAVAGKDGG